MRWCRRRLSALQLVNGGGSEGQIGVKKRKGGNRLKKSPSEDVTHARKSRSRRGLDPSTPISCTFFLVSQIFRSAAASFTDPARVR